MKKLFLTMAVMLSAINYAQVTKAGKNYVGLKTTNVGFENVNGLTKVSTFVEGGHFLQDNLALTTSLGYYASFDKEKNHNDWMYSVGTKYYVDSVLPLGINWNGSTGSSGTKSNIGLSVGYSYMITPKVNIEPTLMYDIPLKTGFKNKFSGGIGVNYFF